MNGGDFDAIRFSVVRGDLHGAAHRTHRDAEHRPDGDIGKLRHGREREAALEIVGAHRNRRGEQHRYGGDDEIRLARAGGGRDGKGGDAARACLRLVELQRAFEGQGA